MHSTPSNQGGNPLWWPPCTGTAVVPAVREENSWIGRLPGVYLNKITFLTQSRAPCVTLAARLAPEFCLGIEG